ncbi:hypothetical protein [Mangrovibrevibacter kandeliae]|uniref:hypothetical protein n=1 Tax=Mangrovibrevibacter kandeliae TaxID=2968473 RepID=UPI00211829B1|nr:hypothetical protein [Aurantimonas sp. CSK15Z-1]MCQ8782844.1 hypothetical protein [Aurantimonas sp. CSK15Z-1]
MTDPLVSVLCGVAGFLVAFAAVPLVLRLRRAVAPVLVHVGAALLGEAVALLLGLAFAERLLFWPASAVVGLGAVLNLFVFSAVYKSVSLQMLGLLAAEPGHAVTLDRLVEELGRPTVEGRMALLEEMGLVHRAPDGLRVTAAGLANVRRLTAVQRLFAIARSGLYSQP